MQNFHLIVWMKISKMKQHYKSGDISSNNKDMRCQVCPWKKISYCRVSSDLKNISKFYVN